MLTRSLTFFGFFFSLFLLAAIHPVYAETESTTNFLSLSDIHFDPFVSCTKKPCPLVQQLRAAPAENWAQILSQVDLTPSSYRDDTNYPLLISALSAAKKMAEKNQSKFVMITGDFLGHDYRRDYKKFSGDKTSAGYQQFVAKTLRFLSLQLKATFPSIDVYPAIGNNDSYHGDYFSEPHSGFYYDMTTLWQGLIRNKQNQNAMRATFPIGGYYAVDVTAPSNLRILILNSVMFSTKARGRNVDEAAQAQLSWLHQQLALAKKENKKVLIAMHIPLGIDVYATLRLRLFTLVELWKKDFVADFKAELQEFYPQIAGIFAGHLHADWFQILTFPQGEIPVSGTPAISPMFGNNPGFKTFYYSEAHQHLTDYATYYYSLGDKHEWSLEYDFNHVYQLGCKDCSLIHGMNLLQQSGTLSDFYKRYYAVDTDSQPISAKWNPYYWCAIRKIEGVKYRECVK